MDDDNAELEVSADDIFDFTLPPVTETDTGYIDGEASASALDEGQDEALTAPDPDKYRGMLDDKCGEFDPSLHVAPPEKTPSGRWKRIPKRERKKRDGNADEKIEPNAEAKQEAQKMALIYGALHSIPYGAGGAIEKTEIVVLADSIERYFNANGITQTPPSLDVILSAGLYSLGVSQRPSNIEKTKAYFARLKKWFVFMFEKRKAKTKPKTETVIPEEKPVMGERAPDGERSA